MKIRKVFQIIRVFFCLKFNPGITKEKLSKKTRINQKECNKVLGWLIEREIANFFENNGVKNYYLDKGINPK